MKTAAVLFFACLVVAIEARASAPFPPPTLSLSPSAEQGAVMVETGFPATRCKSPRLTETQRRHCDKGTRKAASKA